MSRLFREKRRNLSIYTLAMIFLASLSLVAVLTGGSARGAGQELKVVDIERGKTVGGMEAKKKGEEVIVIEIEPTNEDAASKLDNLDKISAFKLLHKNKILQNQASDVFVVGDKTGEIGMSIAFAVPKNMKKNLFLSVEGFSKIPLDKK